MIVFAHVEYELHSEITYCIYIEPQQVEPAKDGEFYDGLRDESESEAACDADGDFVADDYDSDVEEVEEDETQLTQIRGAGDTAHQDQSYHNNKD